MNLESCRQILEKLLRYQISRKSVQWERTTDMINLVVAFRTFGNSPGKLTLAVDVMFKTVAQ